MCGITGRKFIVLFKLHSIRWFMISSSPTKRISAISHIYHSFHNPQDGGERQLASKLRQCHPMYTYDDIRFFYFLVFSLFSCWFRAVDWPCYESGKKLPRNGKCIFNKSSNVKPIKPQLVHVTAKAQRRQCQSYTE